MGLFGITEGAIPFAAQDPLRVIPSIVVGAISGSVIAMLSNVGNHVAHGGPIVAVLGAVDNVLMFFIAAAVGVVITALMVNFLKKDITTAEVVTEDVVLDDHVEEELQTIDVTMTKQEIEKLTDILDLDLIETNVTGASRDDVIDELIEKLHAANVLRSKEQYKEAILAREAEGTTGLGIGIAIPHGKSDAVIRPAVAFGMKKDGVDWQSLDGSLAQLIFIIAVPTESAGDAHLKILQMLSRKLMDESFRDELLAVKTKEEAYRLLDTIE